MASNIQIFDQNKSNMMSDATYATDAQRLSGVQTGVASSQLQNKTLYQVSLVAYAIGQIATANGINLNDTDAVSTFVNNLSSTFLQKVVDKATTSEATTGTDNVKYMTPAAVKAALQTISVETIGAQPLITGAATSVTSSNLTANRVLVSDSNGKIAESSITSTVLGYLSGVTSSIQTQLNGKQATVTGGATSILSSNLTASRALVSDASGKVAVSSVTSTQLGYLSGVTSAIQTQLNNKLSLSGGTLTGPLTLSGNPTSNLHAATKQYVDNKSWLWVASHTQTFSNQLFYNVDLFTIDSTMQSFIKNCTLLRFETIFNNFSHQRTSGSGKLYCGIGFNRGSGLNNPEAMCFLAGDQQKTLNETFRSIALVQPYSSDWEFSFIINDPSSNTFKQKAVFSGEFLKVSCVQNSNYNVQCNGSFTFNIYGLL